MKIAGFWFFAPCSLVEIDWRFRGSYCLHHTGNNSETSVTFYDTTLLNKPEDVYLHTSHRENQNSHNSSRT
jgi:hypothetical protein